MPRIHLTPTRASRKTPNRAAAARSALGLEPGTYNKPLTGRKGKPGRRDTIADNTRTISQIAYSRCGPTAQRCSASKLKNMADQIFRRKVRHEIDEIGQAQRARRLPLESAMSIDWLGRSEDYYRMWSPISGVVGDIRLVLDCRLKRISHSASLTLRKSLYFYALFLRQLGLFDEKRGGLWITPDPRDRGQNLSRSVADKDKNASARNSRFDSPVSLLGR